jgi:hypothetical protein
MDRSQERGTKPNEMVLLCRGSLVHQVQCKGWSPQDNMEVVW